MGRLENGTHGRRYRRLMSDWKSKDQERGAGEFLWQWGEVLLSGLVCPLRGMGAKWACVFLWTRCGTQGREPSCSSFKSCLKRQLDVGRG